MCLIYTEENWKKDCPFLFDEQIEMATRNKNMITYMLPLQLVCLYSYRPDLTIFSVVETVFLFLLVWEIRKENRSNVTTFEKLKSACAASYSDQKMNFLFWMIRLEYERGCQICLTSLYFVSICVSISFSLSCRFGGIFYWGFCHTAQINYNLCAFLWVAFIFVFSYFSLVQIDLTPLLFKKRVKHIEVINGI